MCAPNVEEEIKKLSPELSMAYLEAKETLATSQDSRSERFSVAARIVRAFWKGSVSSHSKPALIRAFVSNTKVKGSIAKIDSNKTYRHTDDPS